MRNLRRMGAALLALALMLSLNLTAFAAAADTGFSTVAHFRRVFKEATGLSPQQYRQYSLRQTREDADEGE